MHVMSKFTPCQNRIHWAIFAVLNSLLWEILTDLKSCREHALVKACFPSTQWALSMPYDDTSLWHIHIDGAFYFPFTQWTLLQGMGAVCTADQVTTGEEQHRYFSGHTQFTFCSSTWKYQGGTSCSSNKSQLKYNESLQPVGATLFRFSL